MLAESAGQKYVFSSYGGQGGQKSAADEAAGWLGS